MTLLGKRRPPPPVAEWAYFFDVDGTLSELVATPDAARVAPIILERLDALFDATGGAVAIVSGRRISDLDGMLRGWRGPMAGQHGAEHRLASGDALAHPFAAERMQRVRERLAGAFDSRAGVMIEDKGSSIAVHHSGALLDRLFVRRVARRLVGTVGGGVSLQKGKGVIEFVVSQQDKGRAVLDILHRSPFQGRRPVFVGDDLSDEAAFEVVNARDGVSVKVGRGLSLARCRLRNPPDVCDWLGERA